MLVKGKLAAALMVAAMLGCSSVHPSALLNGGALTSEGSRVEYIQDPTLNNMNAVEVHVPAKWHFQGVMNQGGSCVGISSGVFRATSPDGLAFAEKMPHLGWFWGTGFAAKVKNNDCLPLRQAMGAQDFLKYLAATLNVEYVSDVPIPAEAQAKAQQTYSSAFAGRFNGSGMQPPKVSRQLAQAIVRYKNGTFQMKGRLGTMVDCIETNHPGMKSILRGMADMPGWTSDKCTATVVYIAAPENQFDAVVKVWDAKEMQSRDLPEWGQAWIERNNRQSQQMIQQMNQQAAAQRQASAQQFAHDQAVRQQMHEQFLSTMQRGTDMSMARAAQVANTNHTIASDWVDYSLDRQTVVNPSTGQLSKVSSSYGYTWVDSSGHTSFQTNDVNADPNGTLQGTWTRQQVVHGDGTR